MNNFLKHLKEILQDKAKRKKMKKIFGLLAVLVLIVTSSALKIPAMTLEKDVAESKFIPIEEDDFIIDDKDLTDEPYEHELIEIDDDVEKYHHEKIELASDLSFTSEDSQIKAKVIVKDTYLPSESTLVVNPVDEEENTISLFSAETGTENENDKEENDEQIEELIEGEILDIEYVDISFYDQDGDYLPVEDEAEVSLDLSDLEMEKSEDEKISIVHFTEDGPEVYDTEIKTDEVGRVEEVNFDTHGFSVFAIVTHGTWKRLQVEDDLYTIITSNETPYTLEYSNNDIVTFEADLANDFVEVADRKNTESPYNFKDPNASKKYKRFVIKNEDNDEYTIRSAEFKKYLAISGSELILSDTPYKFKFYENSKSNGGIRIFGHDGLQILVFDPKENKFKVVKSYKESEEYISDFFIVVNRIKYKILTHSEIEKLPQTSELVIISDNGQDKNDGKRGFLDSYIDPKYNPAYKYRDSTALEKDGDIYTVMEDRFRDGRYKEPDLVKFTKKGSNYFLQDKNGGYLYLEKTDHGEIKIVNKDSVNDEQELMFAIEITGNADEVFLYNINYGNNKTNKNYKFNLESIGDINGFQVWPATAANSKLKLAIPYIGGEYEQKEKLIDAVIPDGYYVIADEGADKILRSTRTTDFLPSLDSKDNNGTIFRGSNNNLYNDNIFKITNQSDGSYIISRDKVLGGNQGPLRITNIAYGGNEYKRLYFDSNPRQTNDNMLNIYTTKDNPDLFYIGNEYASLGLSGNSWVSRSGVYNHPLRLYKVDVNNFSNNKRYTHPGIKDDDNSGEVEVGVLADIKDGNYIIGHGPYPDENDTEKKDFHVLQDDKTQEDAYFYFDRDISEDLPIVARKNKLQELDYWKITQSETPGNYRIKSSKENPSGNKIGSLDLSSNKIRIYKSENPKDPRLLITDGTYRLRYKDGKFISVLNSEPLESGDYHYLGEEIKRLINFKLTTPDDYEDASWKKDPEDKGLELPDKVEVAELKDDEGNYSFSNIFPEGYSTQLGPIGKIYNSSRGGGIIPVNSNPYSNLYRLYLSQDGLPKNLGLDQYKDIEEFAEYAFTGYRVNLDGKTYFIDKDTEFSIAEDDKAIELEANLMENDKLGEMEKISIPFYSDITLETEFKQLSAPLYFYFNPWEGILDVERGISAEELKARENNAAYGNEDKISPIMAEGRILFPEDDNRVSNIGKSAMTMDRDVNGIYRTLRNVRFPNKEDSYNGEYQLMFNRVYDKEVNKLGTPRYDDVKDQILSNELKSSAIDWLHDNPSKAGILKYDISTKGKDLDEISDKEIIIDQIEEENIKADNLGIDFIDLEKSSGGFILSGILYTDTNRLTIEKHFENINTEELKALQGEGEEKFHINLYEKDTDEDRVDSGSYNDLLYKLSFNGVKENEVRYRTPFPKVGDKPLSYWEIERVGTSFNTWPNENKALVLWSLPVKKNTNFAIEEKNFHLGISGKNLETKLGYAVNEAGGKVRKEKRWSTQKEELDQAGAVGLKYEEVLNSDVSDLVDFTNLYSSQASVQLEALIDGLPLKGREFKIYKDSVKEENRVNKDISYIPSHKGTINFSDLNPGSYILVEDTKDEIYEDIGQISFTIDDNNKMTQASVKPPNDMVEFKEDENLIKINYKSKFKNLKITKSFDGLPITDIRAIVRSDSDGSYEKSFKIIVKGYDKDDKLVGERTLTEAQSLGVVENSLSWHINNLEKDGEKISIFKDDKFNTDALAYIIIEEENYEHFRYPVVKRKLFVGDEEKIPEGSLYKIEGGDIQDEKGQVKAIEIKNTYTKGFNIQINVRGRDYKNEKYIDLEGMEFELYGSIDEKTDNNFGQGSIQVEDGSDQYLLKSLETNEIGQAEFDNLSYYDGNKYYLKHSKNPYYDEENEEGSAYYQIEDLLEVDVGNEEIHLARDDYSIEGKYKISAVNKAGVFVINIDFERSNYRLPDTGGLGTNHLYKVGTVMAVLATTLLIYKNKKIKRRRI